MNKTQLLDELRNQTYVRIKPSSIHGIGVFAIRDIPKGCRNIFGPETEAWTELSFEEVEALPEHSRHLIETYCLFDDKNYFVPADGFKAMDLALFLNHGDEPNVVSVNEGAFFEAIRDIAAGEEILVDYDQL